MLNAAHWGFQHQERGDVFDDLPPSMKTSFFVLQHSACDEEVWTDYCNGIRPEKWIRHNDGSVRRRKSPRLASRADARSLQRETLRRQLTGRPETRRPAPGDVSDGEIHAYTDGSALVRQGRCRAGCGVWFGEKSDLNVSAILRGRQTNNRAEITAIILAIRKAMAWPAEFRCLVVFTDSQLCVDGVTKWMARWEADGWTRLGRRLENADLWQVLRRALTALAQANISFKIKHVLAHVGIYGNERADRLAKAAAKRAHRAAARTTEQRQDQALDALADSIVAAILNT